MPKVARGQNYTEYIVQDFGRERDGREWSRKWEKRNERAKERNRISGRGRARRTASGNFLGEYLTYSYHMKLFTLHNFQFAINTKQTIKFMYITLSCRYFVYYYFISFPLFFVAFFHIFSRAPPLLLALFVFFSFPSFFFLSSSWMTANVFRQFYIRATPIKRMKENFE